MPYSRAWELSYVLSEIDIKLTRGYRPQSVRKKLPAESLPVRTQRAFHLHLGLLKHQPPHLL